MTEVQFPRPIPAGRAHPTVEQFRRIETELGDEARAELAFLLHDTIARQDALAIACAELTILHKLEVLVRDLHDNAEEEPVPRAGEIAELLKRLDNLGARMVTP